MTLGERIRKIRKENDLTQSEFGKRIGLKAPIICMIENDKIRRMGRTINAICKEYNINANWLLYERGDIYADNLEKSLSTVMKKCPPLYENAKIVSKHMSAEDWENAYEFIKDLEG